MFGLRFLGNAKQKRKKIQFENSSLGGSKGCKKSSYPATNSFELWKCFLRIRFKQKYKVSQRNIEMRPKKKKKKCIQKDQSQTDFIKQEKNNVFSYHFLMKISRTLPSIYENSLKAVNKVFSIFGNFQKIFEKAGLKQKKCKKTNTQLKR